MGDPIAGRGRGPEGLDLLRRLPAQAQGPAGQVPRPAGTPAAGRGAQRARVGGHRHRHAKVVYVEAEPGVFEGREVVLGPRIGDRFPVLEGLAPGEKVAARRRLPDRRREPAQPGDPRPIDVRRTRHSSLAAVAPEAPAGDASTAIEPGEEKAMIESIIEWSIRNRFLVILASLALGVAGVRAMLTMPVDAIPDLSENQVIVFTDWMGRSPQEIEDQVTYPLSVEPPGAGRREGGPVVERVQLLDDHDHLRRRDRLLLRPPARPGEAATIAPDVLPPGVTPYLAPDATAVGQIFWYTVEGDGKDLGELRSIQDWYVRYQLNSVPGVAEVASVGGAPREYQVDLDPNKLRAYGDQPGRGLFGRRPLELVRRRPGDPPGERRVPDPLGRLDREPRRHPRDRRRPAQGRDADPGRRRSAPSRSARRSAAACWRRTARRPSAASS